MNDILRQMLDMLNTVPAPGREAGSAVDPRGQGAAAANQRMAPPPSAPQQMPQQQIPAQQPQQAQEPERDLRGDIITPEERARRAKVKAQDRPVEPGDLQLDDLVTLGLGGGSILGKLASHLEEKAGKEAVTVAARRMAANALKKHALQVEEASLAKQFPGMAADEASQLFGNQAQRVQGITKLGGKLRDTMPEWKLKAEPIAGEMRTASPGDKTGVFNKVNQTQMTPEDAEKLFGTKQQRINQIENFSRNYTSAPTGKKAAEPKVSTSMLKDVLDAILGHKGAK